MTFPSKSPIFIIGVDRSGTTLLSLILDSHSRIAIPYESHFITKYYKNSTKFGDLKEKENRLRLVQSILAEPYVKQWDQKIEVDDINLDKCLSLEATIDEIFSAYARLHGKDLWGDKTPAYTSEIHIINRLFPQCKFVHIMRDGRDVALSLVKQWWGPNDFISAMRYWEKTLSCTRKMLRMLPDDRYIELKYEELLEDPEREIKKILAFLQLDFEPQMMEKYQQKADLKVGKRIEKHHVNLKQTFIRDNAYKWRKNLSPADQAIAYEIAGELFEELGYDRGVTSHPLKLIRKAYHRISESYKWRIAEKLSTDSPSK